MNKAPIEIVTAVRVCMNEVADNESSSAIVTVDDSEMSTLIESKIEEAINFVHGNAQLSLLAEDTIQRIQFAPNDSNVSVENKVETVVLSNSDLYMRIIGAKLVSWDGFVKDIVSDTDIKECARIKAMYSGANSKRPAIIQNHDENSTKTFELYKTGEYAAEAGTFLYISSASKRKNNNNWYVDANLYTAIVNYCAGLVFFAFNEKDKAQELIELAASEIGIQPAVSANQ